MNKLEQQNIDPNQEALNALKESGVLDDSDKSEAEFYKKEGYQPSTGESLDHGGDWRLPDEKEIAVKNASQPSQTIPNSTVENSVPTDIRADAKVDAGEEISMDSAFAAKSQSSEQQKGVAEDNHEEPQASATESPATKPETDQENQSEKEDLTKEVQQLLEDKKKLMVELGEEIENLKKKSEALKEEFNARQQEIAAKYESILAQREKDEQELSQEYEEKIKIVRAKTLELEELLQQLSGRNNG